MDEPTNDQNPDVNQIFRDSVTSLAFSLTLSKSMIVVLSDIGNKNEAPHCDTFRALGMRSTQIIGMNGLIDRGLAYAPDPKWRGVLKLTKAGELVFELLKVAGLVERVEAGLKRTAA